MCAPSQRRATEIRKGGLGQIDNVQIIYRQSCKSPPPPQPHPRRCTLGDAGDVGGGWGAAASRSIQPQQIRNYANEERAPCQLYQVGMFDTANSHFFQFRLWLKSPRLVPATKLIMSGSRPPLASLWTDPSGASGRGSKKKNPEWTVLDICACPGRVTKRQSAHCYSNNRRQRPMRPAPPPPQWRAPMSRSLWPSPH